MTYRCPSAGNLELWVMGEGEQLTQKKKNFGKIPQNNFKNVTKFLHENHMNVSEDSRYDG
jgi:hypothetical protein